MDTETFWRLVETARGAVGSTFTADYDDRMAAALKAQLVHLPADEIMDFDNRLIEVGATAQSVDMEAAAHLVSSIFFDGWHGPRYYCFINGLILLGRDAFERAVRSPDSLADHPAIQAVAAGELPRVAFVAEAIYDVASAAYCEVEGVTVNDYLGKLWGEDDDEDEDEDDDDEAFDDDDEDEEDEDREESYYDERFDRRWKRRLPRLLTLFRRPREVIVDSRTNKPIKPDELRDARPTPAQARSAPNDPTTRTDDMFNAVLGQKSGGWWKRWRRS